MSLIDLILSALKFVSATCIAWLWVMMYRFTDKKMFVRIVFNIVYCESSRIILRNSALIAYRYFKKYKVLVLLFFSYSLFNWDIQCIIINLNFRGHSDFFTVYAQKRDLHRGAVRGIEPGCLPYSRPMRYFLSTLTKKLCSYILERPKQKITNEHMV